MNVLVVEVTVVPHVLNDFIFKEKIAILTIFIDRTTIFNDFIWPHRSDSKR